MSGPAKPVTINDVARRAGVSAATVSYVLRNVRSVRPHVHEAVARAVKDLDYRPNRVAASLRRNNTMTIGVVVPDVQNAFFMGVVQRVEEMAQRAGYKILLACSAEDTEREQEHIDGLLDRRVNALVVFPTLDDPPFKSGIDALSVPVVFVDRGLDATETDTVAVDNAAAARTATQHLIDLGHRDILLLVSSLALGNMRDRAAGYEQAMVAAALADGTRIAETGLDLPVARNRVLAALREAQPTAVFAATNQITLTALRSLRELGQSVPTDISLVGFDDFDWMEVLDITAVRQPTAALGDGIWDCLRHRMHEPATQPQSLRLNCTLRVRGSTRKVAGRRGATGAPRYGRAETSKGSVK